MTAVIVLAMSPGTLRSTNTRLVFAQPLQQGRKAARHEQLKADLEKRHIVELIDNPQCLVDRRHIESDDQAVFAGQLFHETLRRSLGPSDDRAQVASSESMHNCRWACYGRR